MYQIFICKLFWDKFFFTRHSLGAFFRGESYLAEQFRQIKTYMAEQFCQITHYLAEQFHQIAHYFAEHLIQTNEILFNEKLLIVWILLS